MAKITSEQGRPPKRFDGHVTYAVLNGAYVIKRKSGFTSKRLLVDSKYERCRKNSAEFGRVSKLGKQIRNVLVDYLPKVDNLAICNALTQVLRKVMLCDVELGYGARCVYQGLKTDEGQRLLEDYSFCASASFTSLFMGVRVLDLKRHELQLTASDRVFFAFPEGSNCIGLQLGCLQLFENELFVATTMGDVVMVTQDCDASTLLLALPKVAEKRGVLLYYIVGRFYLFSKGSYLPYCDDKTRFVDVLKVI